MKPWSWFRTVRMKSNWQIRVLTYGCRRQRWGQSLTSQIFHLVNHLVTQLRIGSIASVEVMLLLDTDIFHLNFVSDQWIPKPLVIKISPINPPLLLCETLLCLLTPLPQGTEWLRTQSLMVLIHAQWFSTPIWNSVFLPFMWLFWQPAFLQGILSDFPLF